MVDTMLQLVEDARQKGIIRNGTVLNIKNQFTTLFKELINEYTQEKSSSIKEEAAQNLFCSMMFAINASLGRESRVIDIDIVLSKRVEALYSEGIEILAGVYKDTKVLYDEVRKNRLEVPVEIYRQTVMKDLPKFFEHYSIKFGANEAAADFDYPVALDEMKLEGVYYIKSYLELIKAETEYIRLFDRDDLICLLEGFGRAHGADYKTAYFNIFEVCFQQAFLSSCIGKPPFNLYLQLNEVKNLYRGWYTLNQKQLKETLDKAFRRMLDDQNSQKPIYKPSIDYCNAYYQKMLPHLLVSINEKCLEWGIVEDKPQSEEVSFVDGKKLDSEAFRRLIEKLGAIRSRDERVSVIRESIHSLGDLIDLLEADILEESEYKLLYKTLLQSEQAMLLKTLHGFDNDFISAKWQDVLNRPTNKVWQSLYTEHFNNLSLKTRKKILKAAETIYFEKDFLLES